MRAIRSSSSAAPPKGAAWSRSTFVIAAGCQALIDVADTGIGMTPGEQERLFERFYRAEGAQARQIRGTGLGLAIAREIVLAHGGTIECRSAEGRGSTFRVALPVAQRPRLGLAAGHPTAGSVGRQPAPSA